MYVCENFAYISFMKGLLTLLFFLSLHVVLAQQVTFKTMTIDGYSNWGMSVNEADSNYVLVGEGYELWDSNGVTYQSWAIKFYKYDLRGNLLAKNSIWDKYHLWGNGWRGNTTELSDGNLIIPGYTLDSNDYRYAVLIKIDLNMDTVWVKEYKGTIGNWTFNHVQETPDKGLIVVGNAKLLNSIPFQYTIFKMDSMGNTIWRANNLNTGANDPANVALLSDGGYMLSGVIYPNNRFNSRTGYLVKFDSTGTVVWDTLMGDPNYDEGILSMDKLSDGNLLTFGNVGYNGMYSYYGTPQITKFDIDGNILWQTDVELHDHSLVIQCDEKSNGDIVCAGLVDLKVRSGSHGWVFWLDSSGALLKEQAYTYWPMDGEYTDNTSFYDVIETKDGGLLLGGQTNDPARNGIYANQFLLMKLDSNGCLVDDCGYLTQVFEHDLTAKISTKVYPNPTLGWLNLDVQALGYPDMEIHIVDQLGRKVLTEDISKGHQKIYLDIPKGLYLYQILADGQIVGSGKVFKE